MSHPPREVTFRAGDWSKYIAATSTSPSKTDRKLLPKFSAPRRVVSRNLNSYQLETLEGLPIRGRFSSRRLRLFVPRKGTELEEVQAAIEKEWHEREDKEDEVMSIEEERSTRTGDEVEEGLSS